ncbi:hypothetical protein GCM10007856_46200 [Azospirillum oryzae]|nr:hypothetical protein GCM10007856_46200 [Azospirillum oryzae]
MALAVLAAETGLGRHAGIADGSRQFGHGPPDAGAMFGGAGATGRIRDGQRYGKGMKLDRHGGTTELEVRDWKTRIVPAIAGYGAGPRDRETQS